MKRLILLMAAASLYTAADAQTDTTYEPKNNDTMRVGNILIIKKGKKSDSDTTWKTEIPMGRKTSGRTSTNWLVLDVGLSNYDDQTNYATAGSYLVNRPGTPALGAPDFKLRSSKSLNINIWFFMQRLNIVKKNVSLKYGLGLELNNYVYKSDISYREDGLIPYTNGTISNTPFIFRDSVTFKKNKLAADYLTVPLMLSFATNNASNKKGLSFSAGVSAGYLYSQRNKQKSTARGKERNKGEYDLERFKLSYVGELGIGPVKLYGSYSPKSMYEHSLDMRPYTIGFRFSNW